MTTALQCQGLSGCKTAVRVRLLCCLSEDDATETYYYHQPYVPICIFMNGEIQTTRGKLREIYSKSRLLKRVRFARMTELGLGLLADGGSIARPFDIVVAKGYSLLFTLLG